MSSGASTRYVRGLLAIALGFDAVQYAVGLGVAAAVAAADGVLPGRWLWLAGGPGPWLLAAVAVWGCVLWGRRLHAGLGAALALGSMMVLSAAHRDLYGSPWRHLFHSGGCVLGFELARLLAKRLGSDQESTERAGAWGALGLLGAAYTSAGISKFLYGGWAWTSGLTLQASLLGQMGDAAAGWRGDLRLWVLDQPAAVSGLTWATLLFEAGGLLLLGPTPLRRLVAVGLAAMHLSIFLLTEIGYFTSMVLLLGLGWPGPAAWAPRELRWSQKGWALAVAVLAGLVAVGMVGQRARYLQHQAASRPAPAPPPAVDLDRAPAMGPLQRGQDLAAGWQVVGYAPHFAWFALRLRRDDVQVMVAVGCQPPASDRAVVVGPGWLEAGPQLPRAELPAIAAVVQRATTAAGPLAQACDHWRAWRQAAEAAAGPVRP